MRGETITTTFTVRISKIQKEELDKRAAQLEMSTSKLVKHWIDLALRFGKVGDFEEKHPEGGMEILIEINERLKKIEKCVIKNRTG